MPNGLSRLYWAHAELLPQKTLSDSGQLVVRYRTKGGRRLNSTLMSLVFASPASGQHGVFSSAVLRLQNPYFFNPPDKLRRPCERQRSNLLR